MNDPKTLISQYPLTAEACFLDTKMERFHFAENVRELSHIHKIGDSAFDSVESLMQAIESHLAASRPKPLTEEDVAKMQWTDDDGWNKKVKGSLIEDGFFLADGSASAHHAIAANNAAIDRLWTALQAERAECKRLKAELEATK